MQHSVKVFQDLRVVRAWGEGISIVTAQKGASLTECSSDQFFLTSKTKILVKQELIWSLIQNYANAHLLGKLVKVTLFHLVSAMRNRFSLGFFFLIRKDELFFLFYCGYGCDDTQFSFQHLFLIVVP